MIKVTKDQARRLIMIADELADELVPTLRDYKQVDAIHHRRGQMLDRLSVSCYQDAASIASEVIHLAVKFMYQYPAEKQLERD